MSPTSRSLDRRVETCIAPRPSGSSRSAGTDDHAETLAHHYACCPRLRAGLRSGRGRPARPRAVGCREAGDRAFTLNAFERAARFYERALGLIPARSTTRTAPSRARAVVVAGRSTRRGRAPGRQRRSPCERPRGGGRGGGTSRRRLLDPRATRERRRASRARGSPRRRPRAVSEQGIDALHACAQCEPRERPRRSCENRSRRACACRVAEARRSSCGRAHEPGHSQVGARRRRGRLRRSRERASGSPGRSTRRRQSAETSALPTSCVTTDDSSSP